MFDRLKDIKKASREEIVQYLESEGFGCYDSETTKELREAAIQSFETEQMVREDYDSFHMED